MVERTGSEGVRRPLESMRCEAKMVLIRVDFPKPVCPIETALSERLAISSQRLATYQHK